MRCNSAQQQQQQREAAASNGWIQKIRAEKSSEKRFSFLSNLARMVCIVNSIFTSYKLISLSFTLLWEVDDSSTVYRHFGEHNWAIHKSYSPAWISSLRCNKAIFSVTFTEHNKALKNSSNIATPRVSERNIWRNGDRKTFEFYKSIKIEHYRKKRWKISEEKIRLFTLCKLGFLWCLHGSSECRWRLFEVGQSI